jgi:hypothetical protein
MMLIKMTLIRMMLIKMMLIKMKYHFAMISTSKDITQFQIAKLHDTFAIYGH